MAATATVSPTATDPLLGIDPTGTSRTAHLEGHTARISEDGLSARALCGEWVRRIKRAGPGSHKCSKCLLMSGDV